MRFRDPSRRALTLLLPLLGAIALLTACVHPDHRGRGHNPHAHGVHAGHGPPAHAPAHGYRHKLNHHGGVQISFDSGIGVYLVAGLSDVFFWDDHFYRWHDSGWQTSVGLDHGWISIGTARLPGHLARKHAGRGHGHSRRHHPAKREHHSWNDRRKHEREYDKDRREHVRERAKDERQRERDAAKAHREHEREYDKDRHADPHEED